MRITSQLLVEGVGCSQKMASIMVEPLNITAERFDLGSPRVLAHFLAQVGHESGSFKWLREIWGPTKAQMGYEGRRDLGNIHPGDGKRFMGRGLIQITGRSNYEDVSEALGFNFISKPASLESPLYASLSAGAFWHKRELNLLAVADKTIQITRRINGGTNGLADRQARLERLKKVMGLV